MLRGASASHVDALRRVAWFRPNADVRGVTGPRRALLMANGDVATFAELSGAVLRSVPVRQKCFSLGEKGGKSHPAGGGIGIERNPDAQTLMDPGLGLKSLAFEGTVGLCRGRVWE